MRHIPNITWRNGWPSFRVTIDGEVRWVAIGVQDEDTVAAIASAWNRTVQLERLRRRCERAGMPCPAQPDTDVLKKLGLLKQRDELATIPEIEEAFKADASGRQLKERSAGNALSSLKLIIRTARGDAAAGGSSSVLTERLFIDYEAAKIREAKPQGPAALRSALATAASTINQAKSVFCDEARRCERMRQLRLPDLQALRKYEPQGSTRRVRVPVDDTTLLRLKNAVDDFWFSAPARWLALALCGNLGLRRGSAKMARWNWVRSVGGEWRMYLIADSETEPKGNEYFVTLKRDLWQDMCAVRVAGSDFIVPGATVEDRDRVFDENVQWLRTMGLDVDKPNHELRAIFAQAMKREHGAAAASDGLGHGDPKLLPVYAGRGAEKAVRPL